MEKDFEEPTVCVLDASTYVGFWIIKKLLVKGYRVHAAIHMNGEREITTKITYLQKTENGITTFTVDMMDYHSIIDALKGCLALFCCLDSPYEYDETMVDMEVRGTINAVEACAQTDTIHKIVFTSSLTAALGRQNINHNQEDVDEKSWSDQDFCRKKKLWYALAKTLSEQAAWALAMDRELEMVSINPGLVIGPAVAQQNPQVTLSYLQGGEQMFKNGVLAFVDVNFLADVHIRAFEDTSTVGRYFCFNQIVGLEKDALKLAQTLNPLISIPSRYKAQEKEVQAERLSSTKLGKLIEGTAY